ncbi:MAG: hypothetical protein R3E09_02675 [Novosphingobium sp.]
MSNGKSKPLTRQAALDALGAYQKRGRDNYDLGEMADMLTDESDRGVVVLLGSLLEDILFERLTESFVSMSKTQKKELTRGGGPLSSFDQRANVAAALGLIDYSLIEALDVFKAMRNACAHSRHHIDFNTAELRNVMALLFDAETAEDIRNSKLSRALRTAFIAAFLYVSAIVRGHTTEAAQAAGDSLIDSMTREAKKAVQEHQASLRKRT